MEKIELKHLAPYLPYGLKIMAKIESQIENHPFEHCDIVNVNLLSKSLTIRHMVGIDKDVEYITYKNFEDIKPILRPLSDLVKGGKSEELFKQLSDKAYSMNMSDMDWDNFCNYIRLPKGYDYAPHWLYQDLIKNHFDVFWLIPKGLAIDINTLKQ